MLITIMVNLNMVGGVPPIPPVIHEDEIGKFGTGGLLTATDEANKRLREINLDDEEIILAAFNTLRWQ